MSRVRRLRRATLLCLLATVLGTLAVAASSTAATSSRGSTGAASVIKVGFEVPLTGAYAANGMMEANGFNLGLHDFMPANGINGHKVQLKYVDTQRDPATALALSRALVEQWGANVIEGPLGSNEVTAVTPYLVSKQMPVDDLTLCSSQQMEAYQQSGLGFTSGWICDTPAQAGAKWAYSVKHWTHMTVVAFDYSFGWEGAGAFAAEYQKLGGTIDKVIWVPSNVLDMSSYVSQIPKSTQAVWALVGGAVAVNFVKAYDQFGLHGQVPLLGPILTDYSALPGEGDAANGIYMDLQYCDGLTNSLNKHFAAEYYAKYGTYPGYYSEAGYTKARILLNALKRTGGNASNAKVLIAAMKAVANLNTPRGPVSINSTYDGPVQNAYICQVKKVNGAYRNVPIYTFSKLQPWGLLSKADWLEHFTHDGSARPSIG
jgi:branched-chain amino acid transport system substrate-binding protein